MRSIRSIFVVCLTVFVAGWLAAGSAVATGGQTDRRKATDSRQGAKQRIARSLLQAGTQSGAGATGQGATARGDFNKDGFDDLAVGIPLEDVAANANAGAVNVIYGSSLGLRSAGSQFWTADAIQPGLGQADAHFGGALAAGDFDGDGFAELAIGIPGEGGNSGAVEVLYGGTGGGGALGTTGNQFLTENDVGGDGVETGDQFGAALAAANFGKSSRADLAIGIPGEELRAVERAGAIGVMYGTAAGLATAGANFIDQGRQLVEGTPNDGSVFGQSLAAANFGRSSMADLAVGVPGEQVGTAQTAGAVQIFYGGPTGFVNTDNLLVGDQLFTQDSPGMKGRSEDTDDFGLSLAAANFGKSPQADLAIGVPLQEVGSTSPTPAGAVAVMYGGTAGLSSAGNQLWTQDSPGVAERSEYLDLFGISLAAADFGKSSESDLAVGAGLDSTGGVKQAGTVNVLYGGTIGLSSTGNQLWTQNSPGIADTAEQRDAFGLALTAGNYGKGNRADLTVGVPGEDLGGTPIINAGAVNVIYGTRTGLSSTGDQFWNQDSSGIPDSAEANDEFSASLGAVTITL